MPKYTPLTAWLKKESRDSVELTFAEIESERILNDKLPPNTRAYFRGWDKTPGGALNDAFLNAGWETVMVDLENEKVRFQRKREV